jgi:HD-like signal output (HDOD) protein/signal transduction histidine kinase
MDAPLDTLNALRISGSLPSMPQVLVQLIDSCHDPDIRLQTIARIVDKDAAISAKILQLVNSSAVGAARAFTNLEQAVIHLGVDTVRNLAISVSVQQVFRRVESNGLLSIDRFWHHSSLSALLAHKIAVAVDFASPSEAYLAGLLHDIGKLLLWMAFPGRYAPLLLKGVRCHSGRLAFLEEEKLHINHCQAGAWLCELWHLPALVADAVRYHHHPVEEVAQGLPLTRIISLTDLLAHAGATDPDSLAAAERYFRLPREARTSHDQDSEEGEARRETSLGLISRVRDLTRLTGVVDSLLAAEDSDQIVRAVEQGLKILCNIDSCLFFLPDGPGPTLRCRVPAGNPLHRDVHGLTLIPGRHPDSLIARALRQRRNEHSFTPPAAARPATSLLDVQLRRLFATEGLAAVPLIHRDEVQGLLLVGLEERALPLLEPMGPLSLLAHQAAVCLHLERIAAERAEQLATERVRAARLVARKIAHEINNPVAILRNYLRILDRKSGRGEPIGEELAILDSEMERIGRITLDLEQLALTQVIARPDRSELHPRLKDILQMFRGSLPEDNSITLAFQPWPEPLTVRADADRLRQILLNLLANALDAVSGGGTITVRTEPGPDTVRVVVEDTGPGIDPALQAGLFEDGVSGKEGRHGGFGLAIVRSLAEQMGGAVRCDSRSGRTVFTLTLPS